MADELPADESRYEFGLLNALLHTASNGVHGIGHDGRPSDQNWQKAVYTEGCVGLSLRQGVAASTVADRAGDAVPVCACDDEG